LDKLRNEVTELSLIINEDKHKSIRALDVIKKLFYILE